MTEIEALIVGDSVSEDTPAVGRWDYEWRKVAFEFVIRMLYKAGYEIVKKKIKDN